MRNEPKILSRNITTNIMTIQTAICICAGSASGVYSRAGGIHTLSFQYSINRIAAETSAQTVSAAPIV